MSTIKEISSKNSINSNITTEKHTAKELKDVQNNISGVNLSSQKLGQKQVGNQEASQLGAEKSDHSSRVRVDVSLKNVEENLSDLQSSRKSELIKSTAKLNNQHKSQSNHEQNHIQDTNVSKLSQFSCQDSQLQTYFSQFDSYTAQHNPINNHQKHMFATLRKQLSDGKLLIEQERPFPLKKKENKSNYEEQRQIKDRLQEKRQQALMKIKEIEQQQLQLKRRAFSTYDRPRRHVEQAISKITQSVDKEQVKKALQQYKKFTEQLQRRQEQIQRQRQQQHKLELQKQQELMRIRRQSRRQQVKNNLKQIVERQRVRKSIIQEWKVKQKEMKNKKYLYIEYKEKERKQDEIKQMQHQHVLDRIRKNNQFDKDDIQKHQRKYEQLLEERRQMSRSLVNSAITHSSSRKKYQTSKFHQVVVKEMQEQKKKQLQKLMKVKENQHKDKIFKYQEKIDNEIKPNLHYKKFVPIPRAMSLQALQPKDRWNLGLKYLQKAKKLKMPQTQLKLLITKRQEQDKLKLSRQVKEYKDYLKDIKKDINYDPTQKKLDEILKNKRSYSNYQSFKDAKYMSEYLVEKSKNSDQQKTMLAIKKKMDLLNAMY